MHLKIFCTFLVFTNSLALNLVFLYHQRPQFHYVSEYLIECFRAPKVIKFKLSITFPIGITVICPWILVTLKTFSKPEHDTIFARLRFNISATAGHRDNNEVSR